MEYNEMLKKFNIKEFCEDCIGERLDLENFFLQCIKSEIDNNDRDMEETIYNIDLMLDLIKNLNDSGMDAKEMIIVKYNPMGAWYFEKYEEE